MDVVAETRLVAVFDSGMSAKVALRIGRPVPHPKGDWVGTVQIDGFQAWAGSCEIYGVDSWQTLILSLRFVRSILLQEVEFGTAFHWEDGMDVINVEGLFIVQDEVK